MKHRGEETMARAIFEYQNITVVATGVGSFVVIRDNAHARERAVGLDENGKFYVSKWCKYRDINT